MISNILIIILAVMFWVLLDKYQKIKQQYFEILQQDDNFNLFVKETIRKTSDRNRCIKIINAKYHIGILNAKITVEKITSSQNDI